MVVVPREQEYRRLIRFYRKAIRDLSREFVGAADWQKMRFAPLLQQSLAILEQLDVRTQRWANRNIAKLYARALREARRELLKLGVSRPAENAAKFKLVNERAIRALLFDKEVGFTTNIKAGLDEIKNRLRAIVEQAKVLRGQQAIFGETIARVGFLEGRTINDIRDTLVREMASLKSNSDLLFSQKAAKLSPGQLIKNVADLPFVKIPDSRSATGYRRLRIDKYAEMLARTKTMQASNLARRSKALEHEIELIQVSGNPPLENDACWLYVGKVFALTMRAAEEHGVPHVSEAPNGGAPFHPNCTHTEHHFVIEFEDQKTIDLAMTPPPQWALNRPYAEVEKEYRRRGGVQNLKEFNAALGLASRTTGGRRRRGTEDVEP